MAQVVGVDVGGTFTDLFYLDEERGTVAVAKVPSTPRDQSVGLLAGLSALGIPIQNLTMIAHGTTVATNAVLERKGATCGLITTAGFRDVLELGRRDRPHMYGLSGFFEPLIPRDFRSEVRERMRPDGTVETPIDVQQVEEAGRRLLEMGASVVVVSFLHAYANPAHERAARDVLAAFWPNDAIVLGSEVVPEMYEFERTSTAVVNGYVQPLIGRYLDSLAERLERAGYSGKVLVIQSNGGVMSLDVAKRFAVNTVRSGPAAGVMAAAYIGAQAGYPNVIACDMGGTSLDVSLVPDGQPTITSETMVDFRVPVRVPMIDVHSIGAGGGSIAWIDRGGFLQVGPQSAGAEPGPAAYRRGGTEPTVTDANLVLGRINPARAIGRESGVTLDVAAAEEAIQRRIAGPLDLEVHAAAAAIIAVVNNRMAGRLRLISVERGYDPREFSLVGFGGAGPLHAAALMREVGLARAIIPLYPGISSALGCIMADVRHDFVLSVNHPLDELDVAALRTMIAGQVAAGEGLLAEERVQIVRQEVAVEADIRYVGQRHTLRARLPWPDLTIDGVQAAFAETYRRRYGQVLDGGLMVINLRTTVTGVRPRLRLDRLVASAAPKSSPKDRARPTRPVWFDGGFRETAVLDRGDLHPGDSVAGPAIVEQGDTTTVVDPDMTARVDANGNLIVELGAQGGL